MSAVLRVDRNDYLTPARDQLQRDFVRAIAESPDALVHAPSYGARKTIACLVKDSFDGSSGDALLNGLIRIAAHAAANGDPAAKLWIAAQAVEFSDTNEDDLARELEEDSHAVR